MAPLGADPQTQQIPSAAPQGPQVSFSGMHPQQLSPPSMNPAMPNTSMEGAPGAPTGDVIQVFRVLVSAAEVCLEEGLTLVLVPQPLQSIPAEKILKKPIPDEHLILKTTFESLIQKCLAVAADPVSPQDSPAIAEHEPFLTGFLSRHSKLRGSWTRPTNAWRRFTTN